MRYAFSVAFIGLVTSLSCASLGGFATEDTVSSRTHQR